MKLERFWPNDMSLKKYTRFQEELPNYSYIGIYKQSQYNIYEISEETKQLTKYLGVFLLYKGNLLVIWHGENCGQS
jgi:hypothetical protein